MEVTRFLPLRQSKIILQLSLITINSTFQSSQFFRSTQWNYCRFPIQKCLMHSLGCNLMDIYSLRVVSSIIATYPSKILINQRIT